MTAIDLIDSSLLHIGSISRDLARIVCILRLARVRLVDRIASIRHLDVQRIVFDVTRRPLVDAAKSILRIVRAFQSRDRQLVARRRMTVARQAAVDFRAGCTLIRLCCTVVCDLTALETAHLE